MDLTEVRKLSSQLADDLTWLEDHCKKQRSLADRAGELRLAAAVVRNVVGPYLEGQSPTPLHIAVVGGAGTGKSTVSNLLSGAQAAEANPQAGFTRHPICYTSVNGAMTWTGHVGFLGPLQLLTKPSPSNLDADVYQVRHVPTSLEVHSILDNYVIWDCPDMTTWAASGYIPRLLEVVGLADVVVYVASDERYNDEVPTQFLQLFLRAGKPVICCLTKMREHDAPAFVEHFNKEVLGKLTGQVVATLALPFLPPAQLADPARLAGKYRIPLLNQVNVIAQPPQAARLRTVRWAINYLATQQERLTAVARPDVEAMQTWRSVVQHGQLQFDQRYRNEYLASEKFRRFDEALLRLIDLLELPGVGKFVSNTLYVLRTPYRLVSGWIKQQMARPDAPTIPELPVLDAALAGWLDTLHREAAQRASSHPLWSYIDKGFASGTLQDAARNRFHQGVRSFQMGVAEEVDRTARAIYEKIEQNPVALQSLRGGKLAIDAAAIGGVLISGGIGWSDVVLVPLAASVSQWLVEFAGKQYVDSQREQFRERQQALVAQNISGPLSEWLAQWPATGGSAYERLALALQRIPESIQQLDAAIHAKASSAGK
jgi:hypothetical protein